jgi:hypothetical protein
VQAVKIALEVKKYLVDNDFLDISQARQRPWAPSLAAAWACQAMDN